MSWTARWLKRHISINRLTTIVDIGKISNRLVFRQAGFYLDTIMAQEHITISHNTEQGYLIVLINGVHVGYIQLNLENSDDLLEWLFEVVYLRGVYAGKRSFRSELNSLLQGNSGGTGLVLPARPPGDLQGFKDWPTIEASDIYAQLNKEMENHAHRNSIERSPDGPIETLERGDP